MDSLRSSTFSDDELATGIEPVVEPPSARAPSSIEARLDAAAAHIRTALEVWQRSGPNALDDLASYLEAEDALAPELARALHDIAFRAESRRREFRPMPQDRFAAIVHGLVERRLERLRHPRTTLDAASTKSLRERTRVIVAQPSGSVPVEFRHALAARRWGIALRFEDPEQQQTYDNALCTGALQHMARDLEEFSYIERQFGASFESPIITWEHAKDTERLICDILNEKEPIAEEASLLDDMLRASDLRVRYGVNGSAVDAYVQVTGNPNPATYLGKREQLRRSPRRMVIVSPWNLVGAIDDPHTRAAIRLPDDLAWEALQALGVRTVGHPSASRELHRVRRVGVRLAETFDSAIHRAGSDVRGPLIDVPAPIRECVRRYVRARAEQGL